MPNRSSYTDTMPMERFGSSPLVDHPGLDEVHKTASYLMGTRASRNNGSLVKVFVSDGPLLRLAPTDRFTGYGAHCLMRFFACVRVTSVYCRIKTDP